MSTALCGQPRMWTDIVFAGVCVIFFLGITEQWLVKLSQLYNVNVGISDVDMTMIFASYST